MRLVIPNPFDAVGRDEHINVDGAGAFEIYRLELIVLEHNVIVFSTRISLYLLLVGALAAHSIDILTDDAVPCFTVQDMKADLLDLSRLRRHGDRTINERKR